VMAVTIALNVRLIFNFHLYLLGLCPSLPAVFFHCRMITGHANCGHAFAHPQQMPSSIQNNYNFC
jgi:hypothetical protein